MKKTNKPIRKRCWFCGKGPRNLVVYIVSCESPAGPVCAPKRVLAHAACIQDLDA